MVNILVRFNNVDYALKILKRKMQKEGAFRMFKVKRYYEKPSERKVRKYQEACHRRRKASSFRQFRNT